MPPGHRTSQPGSTGPPSDEPVASSVSPGPPVLDGSRRRRRAVGPTGAAPSAQVRLPLLDEPATDGAVDEAAARDEDLRRDVPPHHGG